jgi:hypothetical protein
MRISHFLASRAVVVVAAPSRTGIDGGPVERFTVIEEDLGFVVGRRMEGPWTIRGIADALAARRRRGRAAFMMG